MILLISTAWVMCSTMTAANPALADAGLLADAGPRAARIDAGLLDAGLRDVGLLDAGLRDAGLLDAGFRDAGLFDAGAVIVAGKTAPADAGHEPDAGRQDGGIADGGKAAQADAGHGPGSRGHDGGTADAGKSALADAGQGLDAGRQGGGIADAGKTAPIDAGQGLDAGRQDGGKADAGKAAPTDAGYGLDAGRGPADAGRLADGGVVPSGPPGGEANFLFFPQPPNAADGTVLPPPTETSGPRASMYKYAAQQEADRARELAAAQRSLGLVTAALDTFFKTSGGEDPRAQRDELARLSAAVLEQTRMAYLAAADHERRRLAWVVKIVRDAEASEEENPLPAVDLKLVLARQTAIRDGRVRTAIDTRLRGYRGLLLGIVAWVDGDTFLSLNQLKLAVESAPDLPLAHLYLGYLHYILENLKPALAEWGKALELDPTNETIRKLIADHIHELKQK